MLLNVIRGDKATFPLVLTEAGTPIDLDGLAVAFTAKSRLLDADDDAVIAKSDTDGIAVDEDPTTGAVVLTLLPEDTDQIADATRLYWDIQVDDEIGGVRTPLSGKLVISADVTRTASETS